MRLKSKALIFWAKEKKVYLCLPSSTMVFFYPSLIIADIDDCADQPCQNGATCIDAVNDYTCNCVDGYTGKNCNIGKSRVSVFKGFLIGIFQYSRWLGSILCKYCKLRFSESCQYCGLRVRLWYYEQKKKKSLFVSFLFNHGLLLPFRYRRLCWSALSKWSNLYRRREQLHL